MEGAADPLHPYQAVKHPPCGLIGPLNGYGKRETGVKGGDLQRRTCSLAGALAEKGLSRALP